MWMIQTRFGLSFTIVELDVTAAYRNRNVDEVSKVPRAVNKISRRAKLQPTSAVYGKMGPVGRPLGRPDFRKNAHFHHE